MGLNPKLCYEPNLALKKKDITKIENKIRKVLFYVTCFVLGILCGKVILLLLK